MRRRGTDPEGEHRESDPARPRAVVCDVNETLADISPLAQRFAEVGAAQHLPDTWCASLLRHGFVIPVPVLVPVPRPCPRSRPVERTGDRQLPLEAISS